MELVVELRRHILCGMCLWVKSKCDSAISLIFFLASFETKIKYAVIPATLVRRSVNYHNSDNSILWVIEIRWIARYEFFVLMTHGIVETLQLSLCENFILRPIVIHILFHQVSVCCGLSTSASSLFYP
jgi:hypothetical protein